MTATPTPLRELADRLRYMAAKCDSTTGVQAEKLGVTYATILPGLSGWVADDLNAAADALSARDEADGEDRARKLYEPDEYEDAFKGRATPPASGEADPQNWPQWVKDAVRNANEAGRHAGRAEATPSAASGDGRSPSYDALLIIVQSVCGALKRAGFDDCDDPGEAIDVMREGYERRLAAVAPAGMDGGALKLDTDSQVFFYEQDFYVLSNFSSFRVHHWGLPFDTSEAAYHWMKFADTAPEIAEEIRLAPSAHEAFKIAERNKGRRRPDWDDIKLNVMRGILRSKVKQHEYVRRKLLATGDRELVENSWRDDYWGWGPNRDGHNMLGKLWMEIRAELLAAAPTPPATAGKE